MSPSNYTRNSVQICNGFGTIQYGGGDSDRLFSADNRPGVFSPKSAMARRTLRKSVVNF